MRKPKRKRIYGYGALCADGKMHGPWQWRSKAVVAKQNLDLGPSTCGPHVIVMVTS